MKTSHPDLTYGRATHGISRKACGKPSHPLRGVGSPMWAPSSRRLYPHDNPRKRAEIKLTQ